MNKLIKIIVLLASAFFLPMTGYPQIIVGLEAGKSLNSLRSNELGHQIYTEAAWGRKLNMSILYSKKELFIELRPGVAEKAFFIENSVGIRYGIVNTYTQLPLVAGILISISPKTMLQIGTGGYMGHWAQSRFSGYVPNVFRITSTINGKTEQIKLEQVNVNIEIDNNTDNITELGYITVFTGRYNLKKNLGLSLSGSLMNALTSQKKTLFNNQPPQRNNTLMLSAGIFYQRQKKQN